MERASFGKSLKLRDLPNLFQIGSVVKENEYEYGTDEKDGLDRSMLSFLHISKYAKKKKKKKRAINHLFITAK